MVAPGSPDSDSSSSAAASPMNISDLETERGSKTEVCDVVPPAFHTAADWTEGIFDVSLESLLRRPVGKTKDARGSKG
jgi:hypothetical protein